MRRKINFKGRVRSWFSLAYKRSTSCIHRNRICKNLSNGTVEILLEGRREEVVASMNAVEERMRGYWTSRDWEDFDGEESHWAEFSIQY